MNDANERYLEYLEFVKKYSKHLGKKSNYKKGELESVTDVSLFPKCEEGSAKRMVDAGVSSEDAKKRAQIGIFDENKWGVSIHEPLRLTDGTYTTFNRWLSWGTLESGFAGVVVVPLTQDGRYIFLKSYRNGPKSWCLEFPRGAKDIGNSLLKTLKNELSEEMGAEITQDPEKIGEVFPDSGVLASRVGIYFVKVKIANFPRREATEAIKGLVFVPQSKLSELIKTQEYKDGDGVYEFKDGFSLSALALLGNRLAEVGGS